MHAYSLPVWLWRTVTLFAWLVEPLGRDWPRYIISLSPLPSCHLLFINLTLLHFPFPPFAFMFESGSASGSIYLTTYKNMIAVVLVIVFTLLCNPIQQEYFSHSGHHERKRDRTGKASSCKTCLFPGGEKPLSMKSTEMKKGDRGGEITNVKLLSSVPEKKENKWQFFAGQI